MTGQSTASVCAAAAATQEHAATLEAERKRVCQVLRGWEVWPVARHRPPGIRWCGKPGGHPEAVAWGDTGDELIEQARDWAAARQPGGGRSVPAASQLPSAEPVA